VLNIQGQENCLGQENFQKSLIENFMAISGCTDLAILIKSGHVSYKQNLVLKPFKMHSKSIYCIIYDLLKAVLLLVLHQ
jgi:hypothetical protein